MRCGAALVAAVGLVACGGSALEGVGPGGGDTANEVDAVDTFEDSDTSEAIDTSEEVDTDRPETGSDVETDGEVDVGPAEWEPVALGDEGIVSDVVIVSDRLGFAASGRRVLRWDGRLWSPYGEPGAGAVYGVWSDGAVVVAVGEGGLAAARAVDGGAWGGAWEALAGAPVVTLRAVAGRGPGDVFAAGDDGTVVHWDGAAWTTRFTSGTIDLHALWIRPGTSDDEGVFAVGTGGQLVSAVDGVWKATQIAAGSVVLEDILGRADGTLIAVGDKHTVTMRRPQAGAWQGQITNDDRQRDLAALAELNGVVRAFGESGAVLTLAGTTWNVDTSAAVAAGVRPFAVADAGPEGPLVALAQGGDGVRFDGAAWSALATTPEATLTDFARTPGSGELWATGTRGFLARRGAQGWSVLPVGVEADLNALAAVSETTLVAVGGRGTIVWIEDGEARVVAAPVPIDLQGVAATPLGVIACGRGGTLLRVDEDGATLIASGTTADLRAVALGGDGRVWIAGAFGTLLRMGDEGLGEPAMIGSGVGGALSDLAATGDGVYGVGDNGVILRASAAEVVLEHEAPGAFLYAVATREDGAAVAVGAGGRLLVRAAEGWVGEQVSERGATFEAVVLGEDGEALAGGVLRVMHVERRILALEAP